MKTEQIQELILNRLNQKNNLNSDTFSTEYSLEHQSVVGAIKSLQCLGSVIEVSQEDYHQWALSSEGKDMCLCGSYEARVFQQVKKAGKKGIPQAELMKIGSYIKIGFNKAMSAGWIKIQKDTTSNGPVVFCTVDNIVDQVQKDLEAISKNHMEQVSEDSLKDLKKRKLVTSNILKILKVSKGKDFTLNIEKQETELTAEMIATGSWQEKKFKEYNFNALGIAPEGGHLHPLLKVRTEFREVFLDMGFTEMPTNNFVESSFWNFDSLFQPQQHPARDSHDTFFLKSPSTALHVPQEYLSRVKNVHEVGGFGSIGYRCEWKLCEAMKNILRTHTTAVTARMLYEAAQQDTFTPAKYFSIDRVFRNEAVDATHLAEFHQIEGCVIDYNLTLGDLIGVINQFFQKLGIKKLKFKPAYNPYTEPSMEIFSYHEGLSKWVEIGNSGVFRPEMLEPMGFPKDVVAIAWGLSLERPTMIKYGINNIRELVGHKVNLQMVHENGICRLG